MLGHWWAWLIAVPFVLFLASCGTEALPPNDGNSMVALPHSPKDMDSEVASRQAAVSMELVIAGGQVGSGSSSNSETVGEYPYQQLLNVDALPDAFSWAAYAFDPADIYDRLDAIQLYANEPVAGSGSSFIGIADFNRNSWRWIEIDMQLQPGNIQPAPTTVLFPADIIPVSPNGYIIIVVASFGQQVLIDKLALLANEPAPPPMNVTASKGTVADAVTVTWTDPALTFDPDGNGPGTFKYDRIDIELFFGGQGQWQKIAEVGPGITSFTDTNVIVMPGYEYWYRLKTVVDGQPGRPSVEGLENRGWAGIRPIPDMEVYGTAPVLYLSGGYSVDPDGTNIITDYLWTISFPEDPGFTYKFNTNGVPTEYYISDLVKVHRIEMQVEDNEGLLSEPAPFFLWAPNDGYVQDDPDTPDPGEPGTILGPGPGQYSAVVNFLIDGGIPNYRVEVDTWFTGVFGPTNGVMTVPITPDFTAQGSYSATINIPAVQRNGIYYFAVRMTDGNGDSWVYMWPNKVTIEPQP